jgi:hypothetical protein
MIYAVTFLSGGASCTDRLDAADAAAAVDMCERRGRGGASFELLSVLPLDAPLIQQAGASIHLSRDAVARSPDQQPR